MKKAERGISFITPDYQEKFRVADGEKIRIIGADGNSVTGSAGILTTITSKQRGDLAEPYTTFVNLPNFANKQEAG